MKFKPRNRIFVAFAPLMASDHLAICTRVTPALFLCTLCVRSLTDFVVEVSRSPYISISHSPISYIYLDFFLFKLCMCFSLTLVSYGPLDPLGCRVLCTLRNVCTIFQIRLQSFSPNEFQASSNEHSDRGGREFARDGLIGLITESIPKTFSSVSRTYLYVSIFFSFWNFLPFSMALLFVFFPRSSLSHDCYRSSRSR